MHLPLLPFKHMPVYLETNAFRLHYMQRLRRLTLFPFFAVSSCVVLNEVWKKVMGCKRRRNAITL
jgi:hypothetical protein